jgi:hypothetical protein
LVPLSVAIRSAAGARTTSPPPPASTRLCGAGTAWGHASFRGVSRPPCDHLQL